MTRDTQLDLLVIEDDVGLQKQLKWSLADYNVVLADNFANGLTELRRYQPKVVTLDLGLPPDPANANEGLRLLKEILKLAPSTKVVVITGNDQRDVALKAVELGAYDYYQKPIEPTELSVIIARAFELSALEEENKRLQQHAQNSFHGIIANSPDMALVCQKVQKIAPTDVNVMLIGESGTGKGLLTKALHQLSERSNESLIMLNCSAIPEALLESELFGLDNIADSSSSDYKKGKLELANKGTLYLDEVNGLPMSLQAKLLRCIEQRQLELPGNRGSIELDIRIISGSNSTLSEAIEEGKFREDLFFRLNEVSVAVPSLAKRSGDISLIARNCLERFNVEFSKNKRGFTQDAIEAMEHYSWPGNVRELENKVKSAVVMSDNKMITVEDLAIQHSGDDALALNLRQVREVSETKAIKHAIVLVDGNISQAAKLLGVTRPTLYSLMDKYSIQP